MIAQTPSESSEAYIALGANLGDREAQMMRAAALLSEHPQIALLRCSNLYETDPVGYLDQPNFINMVLAVKTTLTPEALLAVMQEVELALGRERSIRFGPRTVDLDLLWMEGRTMETAFLTLPHPRMFERAFVLVPLSDIVSEGEASGLYERVRAALDLVDGKDGVRFWKTGSLPSGLGHSEN
ncbi:MULTISPECIES: 2-amino-4-hydroxy-6-hydroxymethyldihydropteridine diphosphokinase [Paenibacillus]|uniref:2-amino-4-hydroxy-6- hydroxymethyldihydropteridine diphosphokinase n=1 Tax=Paenibacillus TaxID=44249 RepID=UPI002FE0501F